MAATVFPANPTVGDTHTVGFRVWAWNGIVWEVQPDTLDPGPSHFIQSGVPDPADGKDGDIWFDLTDAVAPGGGALPGLGGWAEVSDTPTSTYTDTAGVKWNVWTFTANGTLNVSKEGLLDTFLISSGRAAHPGGTEGGGGVYTAGVKTIPAGALPVVVGPVVPFGGIAGNVVGPPSALGALATGVGAQAGVGAGSSMTDLHKGTSSSITGAAVTYGEAAAGAPPANSGSGQLQGGPGAAGIVIVRRPA